jgi:ankyrin repeat protein
MGAFAYRQVKNCSVHDLTRAVEAGDASLVEELIAAGAAVNEATADGMTPLMFAAASGKMEILSLLLARGAEINIARKDGVTALALAAFFGHHPIVRELVARGADSATIGRFRVALDEWARERGWANVTQEPVDSDRVVDQCLPQTTLSLTQ